MIVEIKMFEVQCDNCKKIGVNDSPYAGWYVESAAIEEAIEAGWAEHEGNYYCPQCRHYDDDDIVINESRKNININD